MCGKHRVGLKHHVERALVGRQADNVLAVHCNAAGVGIFKAAYHAQKGGFAAAGGAEKGDELVVANVKRHIVNRGDSGESFCQVCNGNERGHCYFFLSLF